MRASGVRAVDECQVDGAFLEHFRCPSRYAEFEVMDRDSSECGFYRIGADIVCYGHGTSGSSAARVSDPLHDLMTDVTWHDDAMRLPFSPREVIGNFRNEKYVGSNGARSSPAITNAYYFLRPLLPIAIRKHLQRTILRNGRPNGFPHWPVDTTVDRLFETLMWLSLKRHNVDSIPFVWFWPDGHQSCAVMTHDVETSRGLQFIPQLMELDEAYGIRASFQIVPEERYRVDPGVLQAIRDRGFEVNVHDLNHDGRLFSSREEFDKRVVEINRYGREFQAEGFRSAVLYRRMEWLTALEFSYDMSLPNNGHLEAQRGGCCSVTPFFCGPLLEIPVTTTQDYSLFHILRQYSIDLWTQQVSTIAEHHGMASFIVHPDYVAEPRARTTYESLLAFLKEQPRTWLSLPGEVSRWWRQRNEMTLSCTGSEWKVEGPGSERARVAYASLDGDRIAYRLQSAFLPLAWDDVSFSLDHPIGAIVLGCALIGSFFCNLFSAPRTADVPT